MNYEGSFRALGRAEQSNKGKATLLLKDISGASGVKSTITRALKSKCGVQIKGGTKVLKLSNQHKIKRISWAKEYIQTYSNMNITWSDKKRFCYKGPDGFYKAWLSRDDSFEVCKERFCGGVHVWAAFMKGAIIEPSILGKKETFTSAKFGLV